MYVYIHSETGLWTVGHYVDTVRGQEFIPESDHESKSAAVHRVRFLNGGESSSDEQMTLATIAAMLLAHDKAVTNEQAVEYARDILATVYLTEEE